MAKIYTCPDFNFDKTITKILIRNTDWEPDLLQQMVDSLSDKNYEIYVHNLKDKDIQWLEGVRMSAKITHDWRHQKNKDPMEFIKEIDNAN
jgi:hypothetical protein